MTEFIALRAKTYAYLLDDDSEHKKAKGTKKCIIKRELTFKNYKVALFNNEIVIKSQHRFRSDHHKVYTEEVNKIALSSNDGKRIQTFDKIKTYPYGTNVFKVCENEMRYVILKKIILKLLTHVKEKSRNESQAHGNKSQAHRNKLQALKNESQAHRNKLQAHRNESQVHINKLQALKNELQASKNESQAHRNKSQAHRNELSLKKND